MGHTPASLNNVHHAADRMPGMLLTPRDLAVLGSVYTMRQLSRQQIATLHFPGLAEKPGIWSSTVPGRVLHKLTAHGYLLARSQPIVRAGGRPPLIYSLGVNAAPYVAQACQLSVAAVLARVHQDAKLSWLFYDHRQAIADARIALLTASVARGYQLSWRSDEELAALRASVTVAGRQLPVRPDGFLVLQAERQTACFLEVQLGSEPRAYLKKALAYAPYYRSGAYTTSFGFQSMRVLALTLTEARAAHLHEAVSTADLALKELFWSASLGSFCAEPFETLWFVGGQSTRARLLG